MNRKTYPNDRGCEHGQLRRSCPHCEANADFDELLKVQEENQQLKQRELELMAQVERLKVAYKNYCKPKRGDKLNSALRLQMAFKQTPQQSLAEHDSLIAETAFLAGFKYSVTGDHIDEEVKAKEYANQLRQQAGKG